MHFHGFGCAGQGVRAYVILSLLGPGKPRSKFFV